MAKKKKKGKLERINVAEALTAKEKAIEKERCVICAFVYSCIDKVGDACLGCGNPKAAKNGQIVDPDNHCGYFGKLEPLKKEKGEEEIKVKVEEEEKEDDLAEAEIVDPTRWRIMLTREAYETMLLLARMAKPREVQMLTEVEREINTFHVIKVHLIKQTADAGSASFNHDAMNKFVVDDLDRAARIHGWVHSHVEMGNFWSGIDEDTIKRLVKTGGWLVSIVMCVDGRMRGRVDVGVDASTRGRIMKSINESKDESHIDAELLSMIPMTRTWDEIPIEVEYVMAKKKREGLKAEFEEKVGHRRHVVEPFTIGKPFDREHSLHDEGRLFGGLGKHIQRDMAERPDDEFPVEETEDVGGEEDALVQCVNCEFDCASGSGICEKGIDRDDPEVRGKCLVFSPISPSK